MRWLAALFLSLASLLAMPAAAQVLHVEEWVEEWDHASQSWVRIDDAPDNATDGARRFVAPAPAPAASALARFGPFRVLSDERAALVGLTTAASPEQFAAMMRAYPQLRVLELVDCPGTANDIANLRLGRMIRAAGLATHVPRGGSVRSGAVELFLAGTKRTIEDGAEFAVHSWRDELGRQPSDLASDAPANLAYLDYYTLMGLAPARARAFYAMTNSVPHESALWLDADTMRGWVSGNGPAPDAASPAVSPPGTPTNPAASGPRMAYASLDLGQALH